MTTMLETAQGIGHYKFTLEETVKLYLKIGKDDVEKGKEFVEENKERIKEIIDGYNSFKNDSQYNPYFVKIIKLILNI